jgi:hypothetical protein
MNLNILGIIFLDIQNGEKKLRKQIMIIFIGAISFEVKIIFSLLAGNKILFSAKTYIFVVVLAENEILFSAKTA